MIRRLSCLLLALLCALPALAQERFRVSFRFTPSGNPRTVNVAGSFNGWSPEATPMADPEGDGTWEVELELEEGTCTYKFVVDGSAWYPDPAAAESSDDGFGSTNSLLRVGVPGTEAPSFHHGSGPRYQNRLPDGRLRVRLRTPLSAGSESIGVEVDPATWGTRGPEADPASRSRAPADTKTAGAENAPPPGPRPPAVCWAAGRANAPASLPMAAGWTDGSYRYPEASLPAEAHRYRFVLPEGRLGSNGLGEDPGWFEAPQGPPFATPAWVPRSVFYQVFPDRFANGDPSNDPPGTQEWGGRPGLYSHFGGDVAGLAGRLAELEDLGVGALYLNPVFEAPTNHKYDTTDYLAVDPAFGGTPALRALVEEAHRRGIRVILDGVFNHTGTAFFAFRDLVKNGKASPYRDWYFVEGFPIRMEPTPNYKTWWGFATLPKLNTDNPEVRRYLLDVGTHWIRETGIDGWRLDVPNEVPHAFWRDFRREVKAARPDAYITGEIWDDATPWLRGDQFDGVMNYRFRSAVLAFLREEKLDAAGFAAEVQKVLLDYPEQAHGCLLNLLGSHDTPRIATLLPDPGKRNLAEVLQFTLPGTPMVYYGDELGMKGGKDPDCRRCYPLRSPPGGRARKARIQRLARLRHSLPDLQTGGFEVLLQEGRVLAWRRGAVVVALNAGPENREVRVAWGGVPAGSSPPSDLLDGNASRWVDGQLEIRLPPGGAAIVKVAADP